jgi:hypothetical protein
VGSGGGGGDNNSLFAFPFLIVPYRSSMTLERE